MNATKRDRSLKLEQELEQLGSILVTLRASHAELIHEIESLYAAREDTLKQYLRLTDEWCTVKKQREKSGLSVQTVKIQLGFYKNIRSYSMR